MNKTTKWEDVSFIISSEYRKKVLRSLEHPKMPSVISKGLDINKTHISKVLKELENKNMLKCLTPNSNKGKLYVISNYGKDVLKEVDKI